jgi:outer membrane protein TolC
VAQGRPAQAEATRRSARIRLADPARVIRQNVVETRNALQSSAEAVARQREAVEEILKARDASRELFEAGEITLIDTLQTEDDATADQLELVRQLQLYFSTLARLKFEAGEIVSFVNEGTAAEAVRFTATDFVSP